MSKGKKQLLKKTIETLKENIGKFAVQADEGIS